MHYASHFRHERRMKLRRKCQRCIFSPIRIAKGSSLSPIYLQRGPGGKLQEQRHLHQMDDLTDAYVIFMGESERETTQKYQSFISKSW